MAFILWLLCICIIQLGRKYVVWKMDVRVWIQMKHFSYFFKRVNCRELDQRPLLPWCFQYRSNEIHFSEKSVFIILNTTSSSTTTNGSQCSAKKYLGWLHPKLHVIARHFTWSLALPHTAHYNVQVLFSTFSQTPPSRFVPSLVFHYFNSRVISIHTPTTAATLKLCVFFESPRYYIFPRGESLSLLSYLAIPSL